MLHVTVRMIRYDEETGLLGRVKVSLEVIILFLV